MKVLIFLQIAALAAHSLGQQDCSRGACYPPAQDLLLGRGQHLTATSTCGLTGTEVFCTPFGQWKMKCCPCDSRNPLSRNAHTIQNVLSSAGPERWWQSRKDANPVTLELDLQTMYQLDTLMLSFKGPRPGALVIEKTSDFGKTWRPALYMATDCRSTFPHVSASKPSKMNETYCYTLPPLPGNPYVDQRIHFHPLQQLSNIPIPDSQKIEGVTGITGLRVKLVELGQVPRMPGRTPSRFYALREMKVMGSCFCHGHASRCMPGTTSNQIPNTEVFAVCECQHNTVGPNCDRCADLYNDLPWRPAEAGNPHTCKRCECNNHAQKCRFDREVFEASGRRSGGVCEGCMHHTTGPKCDRCAPNYYPNPRSNMQRPDACLPCQCNAAGAENGGQCDQTTGTCRCKANVEGPNCDRCKSGYYGLSASNPLGCSRCYCNAQGSLSSSCDPVTGQCRCRPHVQGLACDRCAAGYWNPTSPYGCELCNCDPTNSLSNICDQFTGQCQCRSGFGGRTCGGCPDNTYGDPFTGCRSCNCDSAGTVSGGCDKRTGACRCRLGVTGARCDTCSRGHCGGFPDCQVCPSCFFTLDQQLQDLMLKLESLSSPLGPNPDPTGENLGPQIRHLENILSQINKSLPLPLRSHNLYSDVSGDLNKLRDQIEKLNDELSSPMRPQDFEERLMRILALFAQLSVEYNTNKDVFRNATTTDNKGAFSTIENAYKESTKALKEADASGKTVEKSAGIRQDALDTLNQVQPANTRDLEKLNEDMASRPNLTPTAQKVCGSTRKTPCTPQQCDGDLCPPDGVPPCTPGEPCVGALPKGTKAVEDTEKVRVKLQELNDKIAEATAQIQESQESANRARTSTDDLANQIKQARDDLDEDLKDTKDFVKKLKDFLSDTSSDPAHIQAVAEGILNAKLPLSLAALKRKLKEIQELASNLPDSSKVLEETGPQLDKARELLEEAKKARDAALGVQQDVEGLLTALDEQEDIFSDMNDNVTKSLDILDDVKQNIEKIEDQLGPALKTLGEVTGVVEELRPQLDNLKDLAETTDRLAEKAGNTAADAEGGATRAAEDLVNLEEQLEKLKKAAENNEQTGAAGEQLQKLQEEAGSLLEDTAGIMKALTDKEAYLLQATEDLEQKTNKLTGLEEKLKALLANIRRRATELSICQG
ncbi:laminin subunit beta-3 [Chanos chanos]|uniref:Laminin subunit beta-3 n=1 Tax=Chanos chanos TaxID=29144 RepID=A0A6J2VSL2_CHACN|nr:laminin subunit beta-3 [Chanos chanos]